MKPLSIAEGVVPLGEFKANAARYLKSLNGPMVITQNGRPAGVLLSPVDFDQLTERQLFLESVANGVADAEAGHVLDEQQLLTRLRLSREQRAAK